MNYIRIFLLSTLLLSTVSCKDEPPSNHPISGKSENTNKQEELPPARLLLNSDKTNLLKDEKTFLLLINNQTETLANLAEYKLTISMQEEGTTGRTGSTLHYKHTDNQTYEATNIEQALSSFVKQTTLKKGNEIIIPFDIYNTAGVTKITLMVTLEHTDKKDDISTLRIVCEGLTPITDAMIQQAKENRFYFLAAILTELREGISVDINSLDRYTFIIRDTALHQAIRLNNIDAVNVLLERGIDFNKENNVDHTPLQLAVAINRTEITKLLIEALKEQKLSTRGTFGEPLLNAAIRNDNTEIVKLLLEKLNITELNEKDVSGNSALHAAAEYNRLEIIKLLLAKGADKTIQNNDGKTPFELATIPEMRNLLKF